MLALVFVCLGLSISYDVAVLFFSQICLMSSLHLLAVFYFNAAAIVLAFIEVSDGGNIYFILVYILLIYILVKYEFMFECFESWGMNCFCAYFPLAYCRCFDGSF